MPMRTRCALGRDIPSGRQNFILPSLWLKKVHWTLIGASCGAYRRQHITPSNGAHKLHYACAHEFQQTVGITIQHSKHGQPLRATTARTSTTSAATIIFLKM